mmetsp:Transcript_1966/g.5229  ORF Transcript_1966/g.5229 Transcript_1966/m.5229 type:complete len:96 (-) Transcript_1966:273-560(-)
MRSGPSHRTAPHCTAPQQNATQRNAMKHDAMKHDVFEPNQPIESAAKRKMWVLATDKKKSTRSLDATIETNQPTSTENHCTNRGLAKTTQIIEPK